MQIANIVLSLGGDSGNSIHKSAVTAAEIAVLRMIHGDESVNDIEPLGEVRRSNREERARLGAIYGQAKIAGTQTSIVESMFPGVAARVFETLQELELPADFFKATGRMKAPPAERPAIDPEGGPTIAEWVAAGYLARNYPPSGYNSKSTPEEIAAAVAAETPAPAPQTWAQQQAAEAPAFDAEAEGDDEEGVGEDMTDELPEPTNVLG